MRNRIVENHLTFLLIVKTDLQWFRFLLKTRIPLAMVREGLHREDTQAVFLLRPRGKDETTH